MSSIAIVVLNEYLNDNRVRKIAKSLLANSHDCMIVAMHSKDLPEREIIDGVDVQRIPLYSRDWPRIYLVQLLKYLEFCFRATSTLKTSRLVYCCDLSGLGVGVVSKLLFKRDLTLIYDAHEYEPERRGLGSTKKRLVAWLEKKLIKYSAAMITVSDTIAREYSNRYQIALPEVVLNAPEYEELSTHDVFRKVFDIPETMPIFLYQGAVTHDRGIELMLDYFQQHDDVGHLVVMGYGVLTEEVIKAAFEFSNIHFHKAVPGTELHRYTSSADFGLSLIQNTCLSYYYSLPNKVFEYLMAGLPVVVSDFPEMGRIVNSEGVGTTIRDQTVGGLDDAIKKLLQTDLDDYKPAIEGARHKYNWSTQESVLLRIVNRVS